MDTNLRVKILVLGILLFGSTAWATPSNTISVPNSFTAQTTISSSQTNANNNEIQSKYNAHSHTDITQLGTVTSGVWNGTDISTQYGGSGQDFSAVASGSIIYFNGTGTETTLAKNASGALLYFNPATLQPNWLTPGTNGYLLQSNGPSSTPSWTPNSGKITQVVNTQTSAYGGSHGAACTTNLPMDDTIPQFTEGDEIMSLNVTPTAAGHKFLVRAVVMGCPSGASVNYGVALFQDSTADALGAISVYGNNNNPSTGVLEHYMDAGSAASGTTLKVRVGPVSGGSNIDVNGTAGARIFGGVAKSSLTVTEIIP